MHVRRIVILIVSFSACLFMLLSGLMNGYTRYESAVQNWTEQLSRTTLTLSENVTQSLFSGQAILLGLMDLSGNGHVESVSSYLDRLEAIKIESVLHANLRNRVIAGAAFFSKSGVLLKASAGQNWSDANGVIARYLMLDTEIQQKYPYISDPVRDAVSGLWLFHLVGRVNDRQGQMLGLTVVSISINAFSDFYKTVAQDLGEGASVSLYRNDYTLMSRWPLVEDLLGKTNKASATYEIIHNQKLNNGVIQTNLPRMMENDSSQWRLTASRTVDHFPFLVTLVVTRALYLKEWDKVVKGIAIRTVVALLLIFFGTRWLLMSVARVNKELNERRIAQDLLRAAHEQLEEKVAERTAALTNEVAERRRIAGELIAANALTASISHQAGMAEVANSVLHNVGNVLNSVNVSVSLIREQLQRTSLKDFPKAAELLARHQDSLAIYLAQDPQGKKLPIFLELLAKQWASEHSMMTSEIEQLVKSVQHIKEIISSQQTMSGQGGLIEAVQLKDVMRDVLALHAEKLKDNQIRITEQIDPQLTWVGDPIKLTQIMLNLIINAQEAMEANTLPRMLDIWTTIVEPHSISITVKDSGVGLDKETLSNIFTYGFSTKKDGHGFGLHASALAANQMGGKLEVFSDGAGKGASFVLTLPLSPTNSSKMNSERI